MEILVSMKKIFIIITLFILATSFSAKTFADSAIQNGINYLGTQLNGATGQIKGGSTGDASPWAAIAFSANGINPSTIKSSDGAPSLVDYLQNNPPTTSSPATDWEKWTLALAASGQDTSSYVNTLKSTYYINNQIENTPGDATDESSDWFGILALIAGGDDKTDPVLTNTLNFILANQNCDGGFGYATGAGSDGNDTAAAIQALVDAKEYGVINSSLDNAIANARAYVLTTQDAVTGGFLYDTNPWTTAPDTDSTTWALMALNVLGMQNSSQANSARTWLTASPQQSSTDGGFTACNQWDPTTYACIGVGSNSTTTSHALIGLAGKGWVTTVPFTSLDLPAAQPLCSSVTPTTTITPTDTPTVTPTVTPTPPPSSSNNTSPTATPTPTPASNAASPTPIYFSNKTASDAVSIVSPTDSTPTPTPWQSVLGSSTENTKVAGAKNYNFPIAFAVLGFIFLLAGLGRLGYNYFWRN